MNGRLCPVHDNWTGNAHRVEVRSSWSVLRLHSCSAWQIDAPAAAHDGASLRRFARRKANTARLRPRGWGPGRHEGDHSLKIPFSG